MIEQRQGLWPAFGQDEEDVSDGGLEALVDAVLHKHLEEGGEMRVIAQLVGQKHAPDRHSCSSREEDSEGGAGPVCVVCAWVCVVWCGFVCGKIGCATSQRAEIITKSTCGGVMSFS